MQIGDGFESLSELDGKLRIDPYNKPVGDSMESYLLSFKDVMRLNLISIIPAQNDIPSIHSGKLYELNINTTPNLHQESYALSE